MKPRYHRGDEGYSGTIFLLPDRGWNTTGTIDCRPRLHRMSVELKPGAVVLTLADTILLTDAAGQPMTGLDPVGVRPAANGFPDMPQSVDGRISLDPEAVVLLPDGGFFVISG